jgi:5-deoxy-glucuronate isomerase
MTMANLKISPASRTGPAHLRNLAITPKSADWTYVGFELLNLKAGESHTAQTGNREVCAVFISGKGTITCDGSALGTLGERMSPFDGPAWSIYMPPETEWTIDPETPVELALCSAPGEGNHPLRIIPPHEVQPETRGKGTNTRHVGNILPETAPADSLLVVEVITPGGHTSSYPPHKHDTDNLPLESLLEETYYHRFNPNTGFGFQRVYTDDRSLDEAMVVEDGDVVMVPRGYHPCAATHGNDMYYLNVMAGPVRIWRFHNDPDHEWMLKPVE